MGEIVENSQKNTPVSFLGDDVIAEVFDHDQGTNGTFQLLLEDPTDSFEVSYSQYLCKLLMYFDISGYSQYWNQRSKFYDQSQRCSQS